MMRLVRCSLLILLLCSFSLVFAAEQFGEVKYVDKQTGEVVSVTPDASGVSSFDPSKYSLVIDYGGESVAYDSLGSIDGNPPNVKTSEFGKIVEASFTASKAGEYVLGNLWVDLKEGAVVNYKDGELHVTDPQEMISNEDVGFIDDDMGWDGSTLKLSGDGVEVDGLDLDSVEGVYVDNDGLYLTAPENVHYQDVTLSGNGKVYLLDSGEADLDVRGAYVSLDSGNGKFALGSNTLGTYVSIVPDSENAYGLRHDVSSDYAAFMAFGGTEPSYVTVADRTGNDLVPFVDGVGLFAVDNDGKAMYTGYAESGDLEVFSVMKGNVVADSGIGGETMTPLSIRTGKLDGSSRVALGENDGYFGFGNDGAMGYGSNPNYILGGTYEGSELRYGVSNSIGYNYYAGGKELIERMFGINVVGDRAVILNDPSNGRKIIDVLMQISPRARANLGTLDFKTHVSVPSQFSHLSNVVGLTSSNGYVQIQTGSSIGSETLATIVHEVNGHLGETYAGLPNSFYSDWRSAGGESYFTYGYGSNEHEHVATFVEQAFRPESFWSESRYNSNYRSSFVQQALVAEKYGLITADQARRIIRANGGSTEQVKMVDLPNVS